MRLLWYSIDKSEEQSERKQALANQQELNIMKLVENRVRVEQVWTHESRSVRTELNSPFINHLYIYTAEPIGDFDSISLVKLSESRKTAVIVFNDGYNTRKRVNVYAIVSCPSGFSETEVICTTERYQEELREEYRQREIMSSATTLKYSVVRMMKAKAQAQR